jgi:hypothetical protein
MGVTGDAKNIAHGAERPEIVNRKSEIM